MPGIEKRTNINDANQVEQARRKAGIEKLLRDREEARIVSAVLAESPKPRGLEEILDEVTNVVQQLKADGLGPDYRMSQVLVRATLGIMVDLGGIQKHLPEKKWSITELGREAMTVLDHHAVKASRDYHFAASA